MFDYYCLETAFNLKYFGSTVNEDLDENEEVIETENRAYFVLNSWLVKQLRL